MEGVIRHLRADAAVSQFRGWFDQALGGRDPEGNPRGRPQKWMACLWTIDGFGVMKVQRTCWEFPSGAGRREAIDLLMRDLAKDDVGEQLPSEPLPRADVADGCRCVRGSLDDVVGKAMETAPFVPPPEPIQQFPAGPEAEIGGDCIGPAKVEEEEEEEEDDDWEEVDDEDMEDDDDDEEDDDPDDCDDEDEDEEDWD